MTKIPLSAKLKHKITFLEQNNIDNFNNDNWQEQASTYAEVKPLYEMKYNTLDKLNFGSLITEDIFMFRLRFIKNIHSKMRIKFKNRIFEIKRIIDQSEQNRILQIIALETQ